jgi:arylsulfatase A-like enzyme
LFGQDSAAQAAAARSDRPNVIVIIADDLGYADVGANGVEWIPTPNIDALTSTGVRFTDGYVTAAVCSTSRAGLLTGVYQTRYGFEFISWERDGSKAGPPPTATMLPQIMKQAGYTTSMVGKWHLGSATGYHPLDRGFDEYYGVLRGATAFLADIGPSDEAVPSALDNILTRERAPIYRGREIVEPTEYLTDRFTNEAISFINRHSQKPFFLYLSYTAPHVPLQASKKYLDRFRSIQDPNRRVYAAMVSALDDSVGSVLAELERRRLRDNTVVIFLSDNGCTHHVKGACSNEPLAGYKMHPWDGGIRVPYIFSWPGQLTPRVYRAPVSSLDIFPTAAALAGAQPPKTVEGVNLLPFLNADDTPPPDRQLYWKIGPSHMVRDGRWKLLVLKKSPEDATIAGNPDPSSSMPSDQQYTLLYDLQTDPGEQHDLAQQHPDVVRRLEADYAAWAKSNVAPMYTTGLTEIIDVNGYSVEIAN